MFNYFRFLSKLSSVKLQPSVPLVLSWVLHKRSVGSICCMCRHRWPILKNKLEISRNSDKRYKQTKNHDEDSDDELNNLEIDNSSQLVRFRTSTMRMDSIIKHALGKSRNKIEVAFYESNIRVNGEKVSKKSHTLDVGDEVDLIIGPSPNNPDFLIVSRVEVISAKLDGNELEVKLRKFKRLLIDNYDNKWKSSS